MTVIWGSVQFARGDAAVLTSPIIGHLETHQSGENPKNANFAYLQSYRVLFKVSEEMLLQIIGFARYWVLGSDGWDEGSLRVIGIFKGFH